VYTVVRKGFYVEFSSLLGFEVVLAFLSVPGFFKKSSAAKRSHTAKEVVGFS